MNTKTVYLKVTEELQEKLNERARALGVPRASVIKQLLHDGMKNA